MKKTIKITALALVLLMMVAVLAACAPASDPDKALEALKADDYSAAKDTLIIPAALGLLGVKDIDCVVSGSKTVDDKFETVTIIYFDDKDAANDAWDKVQEYAEDEKDDNKNESSDWVCKKSGAMIYFGTKNAANAAR